MPVTITQPAPPTTTTALTYCQNAIAPALTASGSNLRWYATATATTSSTTAPTPSTASVGLTSYYVSQTVNGCESPRSKIDVTINAAPTATITASGPTSFCTGSSVTLSAPAGLSYLWSNGATTQSITASASGSYSVTVTNGSNCSATSAATVVTVTPAPSLSITAPTAVCAPGTVNLTAAAVTAGSTLPDGTVLSYWTNAAATTALNSPEAVAASGTYYIKATNGSCTDVKPVAVTVNPAPTTANAGPDQSLDGETATLAANAPQVGSGTWSVVSGEGGSFGSAASPTSTFSGVAGNTYKLRWSIGTGLCPASTDEVTIELKKVSTTTTVADASGVYGAGSVTLTATVQPNPGGGSVDFYLGGAKVGTSPVGNGGVATLAYNASQLNASGTTPYAISASFLGAGYFTASNSGPGQLTITPAPATISLSGLSATYDGSPKTASATTSPAGLALSISYDGNAAAPTEAGTYAVVATLNNANYTAANATGSLVIAPAGNSISFEALANQTYAPNATLPLAATASSGLPVSFEVTAGPASISGNTLTIAGAGTITVKATQAGNNNYAAATAVSRSFAVAKADQTIEFAALSAKTFGDADFELTAGSTALLPIGFAVTGPATLLPDGKTLRLTGAGSVTVTAEQPGNDNYNAAAAVSRTFAVDKATATLQLGTLAFGYDGSAKPVAATTTPGGLAGISITYDGSATAPTAAGSYAVVASLDNPNYQAISATGTLVISKAVATVTLDGLSQTYSATPKTVTASTSAAGSSFSYSFRKNNAVVAEPTAAGSYEVTATLDNPNYTGSATGTLVIAPAALAVTVADKSRAYAAPDPALTGTLTGVQGADNITASYSTTATATSNVGKYPITATLLDPQGKLSNYTVTNTPGELSVVPAAATISLADLGGHTYDGTTKAATVSTSPAGLPVTVTYNGAAPLPSAAGTYAVVATLNNANYSAADATGTLTIAPKALTVKANDKTRTYGNANPTLDGEFDGAIPNDGITASYGTAADAASNVGDYPIAATLNDPKGKLGNYAVSQQDGKLTVEARPVTVTADSKTKEYGDADPGLTYQITAGSLANGNSFSGSIARTPGETVGTYAIGRSTLSLGANYQLSFVEGSLAIGKAPLTVAANNASRAYGEANPAFGATYTGFKNNETATVLGGTLSLQTDATSTSPVGTYAIEASGLTSGNYAIGYQPGVLQVGRRSVAVKADAQTKVYGTSDPALTYTITAGSLVGTDAFAGALGRVAGEAAGSYAIEQRTLALSSNYTLTYTGADLAITKATLTVATDAQTKTYGQALPASAFTGSLNGVVPGDDITASRTSTGAAAGANAGSYDIVATLLDPDSKLGNYIVSNPAGTLTVSKAPLTVTANNATKAYGAAMPALGVSYAGLVNGELAPKTLPSVSTTATAGSPVKAGGYPITALGAADGNYDISYQTGTLTVTPVDLIVTADNKSKVYGQANPAFTASYSGLVNNDAPASLGGTLSFATQATAGSPVGAYDITPGGLISGNYTLEFKTGKLTIGKAQLSATADNKSRLYGEANPTFGGTLTGVQNSDAITASYTTTATPGTDAGTYSIVTSLNDPNQKLGNYEVNLTNGVLTIGRATLTVTADNKSKTYGDANPPLTVSYSGFVLNETASVLPTAPSASTTATQSSGAGNYPITAAGGASTNYAFKYVAGTLAVGKAELTVKANDASRTYGQANPAFTAHYSGYVNGDDAAAHTGAPQLTTPATSTSNVGPYDIVAAVGSLQSANYSFRFAPGTLTIGKATITVGNTSRAKTYGAALAATDFAGPLDGAVATDGITATRTSTGAAAAANIGQYPIKATLLDPNGRLGNYTVTNTDGTLTVEKAPLTVVAANQQRTYGDANPSLTGQLTGLQNADAITASYSTIATAATGVGNYVIEPALNDPNGKLGNYAVTKTNGTLAISPRPVTVTADSKTMVYGEAEPALTYKITAGNLVNNDAFTGALSRAAGTNVGTYAILRNTLALGANYTLTYLGANLTITPQFANPVADTYYTGSKFYWSTGPTSNTVTLNLVTTLKNNPNYGGDMRTARASFFVRKADGSLTPINGAQNLPVGLVNPDDMSTGTAAANVQYSFSGGAEVINIAVKVTGNYRSYDDGTKDAPVTLAVPTPGGLIAGGGSFTETGSAGFIKGRADFGFYVQYNKSLKNPQGSVSVTVHSPFDRTGKEDGKTHTYVLKSNAISVLAVNNPKAQFSGKANIKEIVDGVEQSIEGNCNMQLELMDGVGNPAVQPATQDLLAITVYRANGGVWYSSQWDGTKPVMRMVNVAAKDLVTVHGAPSGTAAVTATTPSSTASLAVTAPAAPATAKPAEATVLEVYPNPIADQATVRFRAAKGGKAQVYLYNQLGALVGTLYNAEVQGGREYRVPLRATELPTGTYFCRLIVNGQVENRRISIAK
ncbi:MBG domain-containing protein [Hymenobacter latericus]|uniref:MBG domain-containing protein n=1 Tax=Hymenobacter sp. YIM 151858-1 TaxID=2987688 RepID=UPI002227A04B|nr:MBG domain-containing protein [Hymenobacter sp. YIM 151858-1]UYZ57901.1 MBG domain-containing protein [Hymenobacter sp. YIM 151858-1]